MIKEVSVSYYFCDNCGQKLLPKYVVDSGSGAGIFITKEGDYCLDCYYNKVLHKEPPDWWNEITGG